MHAVDDAVDKVYAAAVRDFLKTCKRTDEAMTTIDERDEALARHLEHLCYQDHKNLSSGANLLSGWLHVFPEHKDHMPKSGRALQAWGKLADKAEGGPMAKETVGVIVISMLSVGWIYEAIIVVLSFEAF